ncbi:MAG: exodeoxyribonuclease III [Termitinemataceae bacterium]|nr:MAG: exodeoxyribonuclease III [Termitinemataceae bacterium]
MNIITWNVNGIRSASDKGLQLWLRSESPDILCLQETKAHPDQLKLDIREPLSNDSGDQYHAYWASAKKKGYSGVAIFSKKEPLDVQTLGISEFDDEGRVLLAFYDDFVCISAYFPNSQDGGARLPYKLDFCAAIKDKCDALSAEKRHVILCGDYNIAHKPIDLAHPKENEGNAGYLPEERAWMDTFITEGSYIDCFRRLNPDKHNAYTWWSYRSGARARNVGWRLDYFCVDKASSFVKDCQIMTDITGSDHCPVKLII